MPIKTLEEFTVQQLQILDETGKVDSDLVPDLSDENLKKLYHAMTLSGWRMLGCSIFSARGGLGTIPVNKGQEAASCAPSWH